MNQPNPWEALGLPASWAPTQCGFQWGRLDGIAGGQAVHQLVLIIDSANGRLGFALSDDQVRELAKQCTEQVSGITLATALPPHLTNGGRP